MPLIDGFDAWTAACLIFIFAILMASVPSGNQNAAGALLFGPGEIILAPLSLLGKAYGGVAWLVALAVVAFLFYLSVINGIVGEAVVGVAVLSMIAVLAV